MKSFGVLFTLIALLLASPGWAQSSSAESTVKIAMITPDISKPLYVGDTVKLQVDVSYIMSGDSGTVSLVVQRGESGGRPLASATEVVLKGKGTVRLEAEVRIPETRALQVFTPLSHQGQGATSIVDYRVYKVVAK
jgi:hypothetical protein